MPSLPQSGQSPHLGSLQNSPVKVVAPKVRTQSPAQRCPGTQRVSAGDQGQKLVGQKMFAAGTEQGLQARNCNSSYQRVVVVDVVTVEVALLDYGYAVPESDTYRGSVRTWGPLWGLWKFLNRHWGLSLLEL